MDNRLSLDLDSGTQLNINTAFSASSNLSLGQVLPSPGTRNYERLINKPSINGVQLVGNQSLADLNIVSENTTAGWDVTPTYVPKYGEICLYSDTGRIKIGDGVVPIVDLPFVGAQDTTTIMDALQEHTSNNTIHITSEEREFWNAKLNYTTDGETLVFTRN